jgi:N-acetylglutamate synthase-like GNAT family acetyltransferase
LVLLTLVVRTDVRQQGVGRMLLHALLQQAAQRTAAG